MLLRLYPRHLLGAVPLLFSRKPEAPAGRWGVAAGADFRDGAEPLAGAGFVLAAVPAEADPDAVMKRVRSLA